MPPNDRTGEVRAALVLVNDPELDESVVDLGFISDVAVDDDRVAVSFRLPTFWCSPNFAWIMAEDMRAALLRLEWVKGADVRLVDHLGEARINAGVNAGASFAEAFGAEAGGNLAALRETFRRKAYLGRMSRLIEALRGRGLTDDEILAQTTGDLAGLACDPKVGALAARHLELRAVYGGSAAPSDPAFRTLEGGDIALADLPVFLRDIRMTRRGVEANGEMCRILLAGRNNEPA